MALGSPGVPDRVSAETIGQCVREVREYTGHDLAVRQHHIYVKDAEDTRLAEWRLLLICNECGREWSRPFPPPMIHRSLASEVEYQHNLLELFLEPMATECFGVTDRQLMAEYITQHLVAAGPRGLALNELIRELVTNDLAPAGNVYQAVDSLAFDVEDGTLQLPRDHPLRTW